MNNGHNAILVRPGGARYAGWRGELLAKYFLTGAADDLRVTELAAGDSSRCDLLVETRDGVRLFVEVRAYASLHLGIPDPASVESLRIRVPADQAQTWRHASYPVAVFLIDADTEHGRFLLIDESEVREDGTEATLTFPRRNLLSFESVRGLIDRVRNRSAVGPAA